MNHQLEETWQGPMMLWLLIPKNEEKLIFMQMRKQKEKLIFRGVQFIKQDKCEKVVEKWKFIDIDENLLRRLKMNTSNEMMWIAVEEKIK